MKAYDDQSASWQEGYDNFYDWSDSDGDLDDVAPYTNTGAPVWADPVEYSKGWDHANYENVYEGYKLAKGGIRDA